MYPEDEIEIRRHVEAVINVNRSSPILTPIVELSVHNLRSYTAMGFTSSDVRTAVLLVEVNDNKPTLCEYLRGRKTVTDQEFIAILYQILEGLAGAHDEGIIHRNLHPDSVFILKKPTTILKKKSDSSPSKKLTILSNKNSESSISIVSTVVASDIDIPICRLGDFWFLRNPREAGCTYSQGRADWGDKSTAPPEARGGFKLSYSSDIYAFGLCILIWSKCIDRQEDLDLDMNKESAHLQKKRKAKAAARDIMLGIGTTGTSNLPPNEPLRSLGNLLPSRYDFLILQMGQHIIFVTFFFCILGDNFFFF
jgi:serine/threonine protein kinase